MDRPRPWPRWWPRSGPRRWKGRRSRSSSAGGTAGPLLATASSACPPWCWFDLDPAGGLVVADVVDQVGDQALGQAGVAQGRGGVQGGVEVELAALALGVAGQQDLVGDRGQVGNCSRRSSPARPRARTSRASISRCCCLLAARTRSEGGLEDWVEAWGSARATSIAVRSRVSGPRASWGVGHSCAGRPGRPFGCRRRLQPGQQPVDGVGQVLSLVVGPGDGEALVQVGLRDLAGGGGDGPQLQHPAGHQPAGRDRDRQHDRQRDSGQDAEQLL